MTTHSLPTYKNIPPVDGMPHGCAWGLWDKDDEADQVGSLNLLTPSNTLEARKEIQTGVSVSLNWPLERIEDPGHNRTKIKHRFLDLKPALVGHDDEICINTQTSSQWDGLRHWAHQDTGKYYNGLTHDEISGERPNLRNGIQEWSKRGGVVGRGVLLDYVAWAEKRGIEYSAASKHCISHLDLEAIAVEEGLKLRVGDILMVRTGWIKWYNESTSDERVAGCKTNHNYVGVEGTAESIKWLWDHHFSALVGDNMAFEAWPAEGPYSEHDLYPPMPHLFSDEQLGIHDNALALWGTPLGELWDLEELADQCKKHGRWSFFVTSCPLNVAGGVASPPNALAIF